jgi:hypothetical protein
MYEKTIEYHLDDKNLKYLHDIYAKIQDEKDTEIIRTYISQLYQKTI